MTDYIIDKATLTSEVERFAGKEVLIIGDVMVDEYLIGDAVRISPEAPVPVVHVTEDKRLAGGAANVARNIRTLGGIARLVSVCGTGPRSLILHDVLNEQGIEADLVEIPGRPTTIKTRVIARHQQMVRIDREDSSPVTGTDLDEVMKRIAAQLAGQRVVIVSDYGKGLITADFMKRLRALCDAELDPPAILVDPKTPNFHLYTGVDMLTPNAKETSEGAGLPVGNQQQILEAGDAIFEKLGCRNLLTTLGANGMALFEGPNTVWHVPTVARSVFDVTGAGDTVIATAGLARSAGISLLDSCILANYAAGIVVGQVGAASVTPDELCEAIRTVPTPPVRRWR